VSTRNEEIAVQGHKRATTREDVQLERMLYLPKENAAADFESEAQKMDQRCLQSAGSQNVSLSDVDA
jgi:hypothetical protein